MKNRYPIFFITMIIASGGIVAAIPLTNIVFAEKCGLGTQDEHCSGLGTQHGQAGNFKCNESANQCSFSGALAPGQGGRCTGNLIEATDCVGKLNPNDFPVG